MEPKKAEERGSEKMLNARYGSRTFTDAELKRYINLFQQRGINLTDYFPLGRPAVEAILGSATVKTQDFGSLITELIGLEGVRHRAIKVFPKGLPAVTEIQIDFEAIPAQK